jgi:sigma-E factor negative regulatory protein RseA
MKQDISALMDGELDARDADQAIRTCSSNEELKARWNEYHLIGELMRDQRPRPSACVSRVMAAIDKEPTVLAPRRRVLETTFGRIALAAAASVATIGMVSWIGTQGGAPGVSSTPSVAKSAPVSAIKPVAATTTVAPSQAAPDVQEYLSAHRQVPSPDAYRAVSNRGTAAAR